MVDAKGTKTTDWLVDWPTATRLRSARDRGVRNGLHLALGAETETVHQSLQAVGWQGRVIYLPLLAFQSSASQRGFPGPHFRHARPSVSSSGNLAKANDLQNLHVELNNRSGCNEKPAFCRGLKDVAPVASWGLHHCGDRRPPKP